MSAAARWWRRRPGPATPPGWVPLRRGRPGPRRWLAAGCVAAAVAAALQVVAPDDGAGLVRVVVAARDVPAGAALQTADLRAELRRPAELPSTAARDPRSVVGHVVAAGIGTGELVTSGRLVGAGLLTGRPPGDVAAPVRLADPQVAALLRAGARVDVLVSGEEATAARTVARGATVLAVPAAADGTAGGLLGGPDGGSGGLVLLAVDASTAADLAEAAAHGAVSVVLR